MIFPSFFVTSCIEGTEYRPLLRGDFPSIVIVTYTSFGCILSVASTFLSGVLIPSPYFTFSLLYFFNVPFFSTIFLYAKLSLINAFFCNERVESKTFTSVTVIFSDNSLTAGIIISVYNCFITRIIVCTFFQINIFLIHCCIRNIPSILHPFAI